MHEEIEDYLEASGLQWTHLWPSQFMEVYCGRLIHEGESLRITGPQAPDNDGNSRRAPEAPGTRVDLSTHRLFGIQPTYFEEFVRAHAAAFGKAAHSLPKFQTGTKIPPN